MRYPAALGRGEDSKGRGDGQTAAFCSVTVERWFPSALSGPNAAWQPSLCLGHAEAKLLDGLSHRVILTRPWEVARQRTGLALWTFSSQLSNRRGKLKEKLPWGSWHPAQVSQHPMINGIPRLGMPLNAGPLLPAPLISSLKEGKREATGHTW